MQLETIEFVLRTAIEDVVDLQAERAESRGLEIACLLHHDLPLVVRGDPGRLRQILTNLIGNAIAFTQTGEVVLRARLAEDSGEDVMVRFEVSDTGLGISTEGRELTVSKNLAELMGGELGLDGVPGMGSTYWFTVKLHKVAASLMMVATPREDLRGLRAIAVDDNETNLQLVRAQTHAWGMVCDISTRGVEALEMIGAAALQQPYDMAILDMQMPGMDGLELAQAIKRVPSNDKMRLVLMTSIGQRGHAARSEHVGVSAFLTKPVRQSQLYDCLTTVMGSASSASSASSPSVPQTAKIITAYSLKEAKDLRRPRVLLAEDSRTNQMVIVGILRKLGYQTDVAANGLEAVEACRTVDYGLVLMDNQMPEMDGLDATREIRKFELVNGKPPVPIVALTANATPGDREICIAAGMNDYLSKPCGTTQLVPVLERWVPLPVPAAPPHEAVAALQYESAIDSRVFDEFKRSGTPVSTHGFVNALIDQYLAESTSRMETIKDALDRHDAPALRRATHSLNGASSTVGAHRMAAVCGEIETLARETIFEGTTALVTALEHEFIRVRLALHVEQGIAEK